MTLNEPKDSTLSAASTYRIILELATPAPRADALARIESIARTISLVCIPIALAVLGFWIQSAGTQRAVDKDYVQIASAILSDSGSDVALREWAVRILDHHSPIPFDKSNKGLGERIASGKSKFPNGPFSGECTLLVETSAGAGASVTWALAALPEREQLAAGKTPLSLSLLPGSYVLRSYREGVLTGQLILQVTNGLESVLIDEVPRSGGR